MSSHIICVTLIMLGETECLVGRSYVGWSFVLFDDTGTIQFSNNLPLAVSWH